MEKECLPQDSCPTPICCETYEHNQLHQPLVHQ